MGLIAAKRQFDINQILSDNILEYDEIKSIPQFFTQEGEFKWPEACHVWYARKFWDMLYNIPKFHEAIVDQRPVRINKDLLKQMIDFYAYHSDYFDGFEGLPRLCELYQMYDNMILNDVILWLWMSY